MAWPVSGHRKRADDANMMMSSYLLRFGVVSLQTPESVLGIFQLMCTFHAADVIKVWNLVAAGHRKLGAGGALITHAFMRAIL